MKLIAVLVVVVASLISKESWPISLLITAVCVVIMRNDLKKH